MPETGACEFQFHMDIGKSEFLGWGGVFSAYQAVTPKNEKLDLDILQHLEQLLW